MGTNIEMGEGVTTLALIEVRNMNKDIITSKYFWKATAIRALKTFIQTILGVWTAGLLITQIEWKAVLITAFSSALYSVLTSIASGLPEVDPYEYEGEDNGN